MNVFRLRVAIGVLAIMFAVGHAWLGGVSTVLEAAAPTGCPRRRTGRHAVGSRARSSRADLSEVVTGWYEYSQQSNGTQSLTHATVCSPGTPGPIAVAAASSPGPDTRPALTAHPTRDGRSIAQTWIVVDMAWFTPIYGLLLIAAAVVRRRQPVLLEPDRQRVALGHPAHRQVAARTRWSVGTPPAMDPRRASSRSAA